MKRRDNTALSTPPPNKPSAGKSQKSTPTKRTGGRGRRRAKPTANRKRLRPPGEYVPDQRLDPKDKQTAIALDRFLETQLPDQDYDLNMTRAFRADLCYKDVEEAEEAELMRQQAEMKTDAEFDDMYTETLGRLREHRRNETERATDVVVTARDGSVVARRHNPTILDAPLPDIEVIIAQAGRSPTETIKALQQAKAIQQRRPSGKDASLVEEMADYEQLVEILRQSNGGRLTALSPSALRTLHDNTRVHFAGCAELSGVPGGDVDPDIRICWWNVAKQFVHVTWSESCPDAVENDIFLYESPPASLSM